MSKLNYKHLYEMELKAYRELYDKLEKEDIIIEHNMLSSEVKVHNIALEKCKKEYRKSADKLNIYIQDKNAEIRDKDKKIKELTQKVEFINYDYEDLEEEFEELSDNYFTLKTKYDELCEKHSVSETLRHILTNYIINN